MTDQEKEDEAKAFWKDVALAMVRAAVPNKYVDRRPTRSAVWEIAEHADALTEEYTNRFLKEEKTA